MDSDYRVINPAILYWGTPVVLISTINEDGTPNLAPMSSAFWLGHRCILGLGAESQTTINILRTKQCVLNLPSDEMADNVNGITRTTGSKTIPEGKLKRGYIYQPDKFGAAMLDPLPSDLVNAPRASGCPVQMEAELVIAHGLMEDQPLMKGHIVVLEVKIIRVHVKENLTMDGHENRIDPDKWRPLIMSFQKLYGLSPEIAPSVLAQIDEDHYRLPCD